MTEFCIECKRIVEDGHQCKSKASQSDDMKAWRTSAESVCGQSCEHWGTINGSTGCTLIPQMQKRRPNKPCDIGYFIRKGRGCFDADSPRFDKYTPPPIVFPKFYWPTKGGERALCTIVIGDKAKELARYTLPRMKRYADRCDAELIVVTEDLYPKWPMGNKFYIQSVASNYDRTYYCDIDVWIKDTAPNVFDTWPAGRIWMHRDRDYLSEDRIRASHLDNDEILLQKPGMVEDWWNAGIALIDRQHAHIWEPPTTATGHSHTLEQSSVECRIKEYGYSVGLWPLEWNCQYWISDRFWSTVEAAHIIHLAGIDHDTRMQCLRLLAC